MDFVPLLAFASAAFNALRCACLMRSVDGHALPIDELKGTKPVESIDLSRKGLEVASSIIIGACIKENSVLKELKCAACPLHLTALTAYDASHLRPFTVVQPRAQQPQCRGLQGGRGRAR